MSDMSSTDLAAAFAKAGFKVSSIDPEGLTPEERDALRQKREREAQERHLKKVEAFIRKWEDEQVRMATTPPQEPTPERRQRGHFCKVEVIDAETLVDAEATMLDKLAAREIITPEQAQGGHDLAALLRRMQIVPEARSCLDTSPVGYSDAAEPTHAELRDKQDRDELYLACGTFTWRELRRVCVDQDPPKSIDRLRTGLDLCVAFWG